MLTVERCPFDRPVGERQNEGMQTENLIVKDEGAVTRITLNRPEKRNALSHDLMAELIPALKGVTAPVVVIEGAGPCLSAGHDLSEMTGRPLAFYQELFTVCTELMETIQSIPQPVIAKVHGFATAAGCQLVGLRPRRRRRRHVVRHARGEDRPVLLDP